MKKSIFVLFLAFSFSLQAQKSAEIGIKSGISYYTGEINTWPFETIRQAFGGYYRHSFDKRMALRGGLNVLWIAAEDASKSDVYKIERGQSLKARITELSIVGEYNFMPYIPGDIKTFPYTPYVFFGFAYFHHSTQLIDIPISFPMGAGFKYNLSNKFIVSAEYSIQKTLTDELDFNYAPPRTNYPQKSHVHSKDYYGIATISLSYRIDYRRKCRAFD